MSTSLSRRTLLAAGAATAAGMGTGLSGRATATAAGSAAYPKGVQPTTLHVLPEGAIGPADSVLAATLQWQLARRSSEGIYLNIPGLGYGVWLDDLASRYGVRLVPATDVWALVDRFKSLVSGYVLYTRPEVNAATSLAGITGAVAIDESQEALARQHGLNEVHDVRGRDDAWVRKNYWNRLRHDVAVEQKTDFDEQRGTTRRWPGRSRSSTATPASASR